MTQSNEKRPVGRPRRELSSLDEGWQDKLLILGKQGASDIEMRFELGISDDVWYRWMEEEPEFTQAVKRARQACQIWWERTGRDMAIGEIGGNATTWIFNMKNRFGWKDKIEQDNLSSDNSFKPHRIEIVGVTKNDNSKD